MKSDDLLDLIKSGGAIDSETVNRNVEGLQSVSEGLTTKTYSYNPLLKENSQNDSKEKDDD